MGSICGAGGGGGGLQFEQNGQKLHDNYKINIFWEKQWWNPDAENNFFLFHISLSPFGE